MNDAAATAWAPLPNSESLVYVFHGGVRRRTTALLSNAQTDLVDHTCTVVSTNGLDGVVAVDAAFPLALSRRDHSACATVTMLNSAVSELVLYLVGGTGLRVRPHWTVARVALHMSISRSAAGIHGTSCVVHHAQLSSYECFNVSTELLQHRRLSSVVSIPQTGDGASSLLCLVGGEVRGRLQNDVLIISPERGVLKRVECPHFLAVIPPMICCDQASNVRCSFGVLGFVSSPAAAPRRASIKYAASSAVFLIVTCNISSQRSVEEVSLTMLPPDSEAFRDEFAFPLHLTTSSALTPALLVECRSRKHSTSKATAASQPAASYAEVAVVPVARIFPEVTERFPRTFLACETFPFPRARYLTSSDECCVVAGLLPPLDNVLLCCVTPQERAFRAEPCEMALPSTSRASVKQSQERKVVDSACVAGWHHMVPLWSLIAGFLPSLRDICAAYRVCRASYDALYNHPVWAERLASDLWPSLGNDPVDTQCLRSRYRLLANVRKGATDFRPVTFHRGAQAAQLSACDQNMLTFAFADRRKLWVESYDIQTHSARLVLQIACREAPSCIAVSSNGRIVAYACSGVVRMLPCAGPATEPLPLAAPKNRLVRAVRQLTFLHVDDRLVSVSLDRVEVWSVSAGAYLFCFSIPNVVLLHEFVRHGTPFSPVLPSMGELIVLRSLATPNTPCVVAYSVVTGAAVPLPHTTARIPFTAVACLRNHRCTYEDTDGVFVLWGHGQATITVVRLDPVLSSHNIDLDTAVGIDRITAAAMLSTPNTSHLLATGGKKGKLDLLVVVDLVAGVAVGELLFHEPIVHLYAFFDLIFVSTTHSVVIVRYSTGSPGIAIEGVLLVSDTPISFAFPSPISGSLTVALPSTVLVTPL